MSETNPPQLVSIWYRRAFEVLFGLTLLAILAAIVTPTLMRSRMTSEDAINVARMRELHPEYVQFDVAQAKTQSGPTTATDRKIARTASLDVTVKEPRELSDRAAQLAAGRAGYVQSSNSELYLHSERITMVVRLPNANLEAFLKEVKSQVLKVDSERFDSKDVTAEWVDTDARLRTARREEEQYLTIMKRAASVKDTLEVSGKLAAVRERIERMAGEQKLLEHQVAMSTVTLVLAPEELPVVSRLIWHPWQNLKIATVESAQGLANYADTMLSFLVKLPVILLWTVTLLAAAVVTVRGVRVLWYHWLRKILRIAEPAAQN